jgi:sulfatase maturation enzyme AslB (radical SAM superfamily)
MYIDLTIWIQLLNYNLYAKFMTMYRIILNITKACNYNCSYCWVIKDAKNMNDDNVLKTINFLKKNNNQISKVKFFWWEPLLEWQKIIEIINQTNSFINNNYEIVTNWSLLNNNTLDYFLKYFSNVFFSIDTENKTDYNILEQYNNLNIFKRILSYNIIIIPWEERLFLDRFLELYNNWYRKFNIMPVYFTMDRNKKQLTELSKVMKYILDKSLEDKTLILNGFMENKWKEIALVNKDIFVDVDWQIYYSDIISTKQWSKYKKELYLWNINDFDLSSLGNKNFLENDNVIKKFEDEIYENIKWQKELKKIMDYFSVYLTDKNKD